VGKCPNWTSPKYWGYNLQQIRFQVMFKIPKMGHLPNPVIAGFKLLWIGYLSTREMWKSAGDLNPFAGMGMGWLTDYSWLGCLRGASQDTMPFYAFSPFLPRGSLLISSRNYGNLRTQPVRKQLIQWVKRVSCNWSLEYVFSWRCIL